MAEDTKGIANGLARMLAEQRKWDLVGPSVEDDLRRAINRYGKKAVLDAAKKLAKPKRGRPRINDWSDLRDVVRADAEEWLEGGDPIARRSNYSIAKEFAECHPGQSPISTHQRIERKLAKKPYDRRWHMLATAESLTRHHYSYILHIRALEELGAIDNGHPMWIAMLSAARSDLADYEAKTGDRPDIELTMKEVQDVARDALLAIPSQPRPAGGIFGRLGQARSAEDAA